MHPNRVSTLGELYHQAVKQLAKCGVDQPQLDARVIIEHTMSLPEWSVIINPQLSVESSLSVIESISRRCKREPVSRILGYRGFWQLDFVLDPGVFDPRPDSEILVETALQFARHRPAPRVLDLGCGTGCLLLSIVHELPAANGVGVDLSDQTLANARVNARRHGLDNAVVFRCGNWCQQLDGRFDLIVCNPPYVCDDEFARLPAEVAFDPRLALAGGHDGLDCYRIVGPQLAAHLVPQGLALFEVGWNQAGRVKGLLKKCGLSVQDVIPDLSGHDRCLVVQSSS